MGDWRLDSAYNQLDFERLQSMDMKEIGINESSMRMLADLLVSSYKSMSVCHSHFVRTEIAHQQSVLRPRLSNLPKASRAKLYGWFILRAP